MFFMLKGIYGQTDVFDVELVCILKQFSPLEIKGQMLF